jgi:metal transporter CNNM
MLSLPGLSRVDEEFRDVAEKTSNKTLAKFGMASGNDALLYYLNGALSILLVLLGGLFAGLTLA